MKKLLSLLIITSLLLSAISFTSCNDEQINTSSTASSTNAPHEHNYVSEITEPTYTEEGYTTYTCECGDSYVSDYVDALVKPSGELKFALWEDNESYSVIGIGKINDIFDGQGINKNIKASDNFRYSFYAPNASYSLSEYFENPLIPFNFLKLTNSSFRPVKIL